jgi:hypothetical protein
MAVSIADMERVALGGDNLRFSEDIGNVIELGDLSDDLGLSMLANPSKVSVNHASQADTSRTISINSFAPPLQSQSQSGFGGSGSGGLGGIEIGPLEPLEPISLDNFGGPPVEVSVAPSSTAPAPAAKSMFGGLFGNSQSATGPGIQLATPARDPEAEKKEKSEYLNKLQRLEAKGFPVARKFTLDNSLDEIKAEYFRLVDARQLETSLKFQRQMMMGAITGMEWLNGKFDPFDIKLDGWSESVHENIEDFDEIFEELYDKYKDRGKMSPEMRLVMAVGGSGFMCHVSNTFFRSKMPSMDEVLRKNPDLARQMATAAAQEAGPGFGNFMGMAMGSGGGAPPPPQNPLAGLMPQGFPGGPFTSPATAPTGAFFGASAATPMSPPEARAPPQQSEKPTARREMTGPTGMGVDDILRTFEEARRAEMSAQPQPATGFATQPAVAAAMNSSASIADDMSQSHAESTATGTGRRKKRSQPPTGSTVILNV